MTRPGGPVVRRHPLVHRDILETADYIARDNLDAALRFFDEVESTLEGLLAMPGKGASCGFADAAVADIRFYSVSHFRNYLIFYRPTSYGLYVLSIRHGARDLPGDLATRG